MMMPAAQARDSLRFLPLALDAVSGLMPPFRIIDASFPAAACFLAGAPAEMCYFPETLPEGSEAFYTRFRQDGGRRPVLPFSAALTMALNEESETPLLSVHGTDALSLAAALQLRNARPPVLLLRAGPRHPAIAALREAGYRGQGCFRLVQAEHAESFCFLSAELDSFEILTHVYRAAVAFAEERRMAMLQSGDEAECVVARLPAAHKAGASVALSALNFVHDAERLPEGDGNYSWLWVAGSPHIRFLLGAAAGRFSRVRVIMCNTLSTANLEGAKLLLNGQVVPARTEQWGETTGAVSAAVPDSLPAPLVLGVWMPQGLETGDGSPKLFVSIDRIELTA